MKYCIRCGKVFSCSSNLYKHLVRKKECPATYIDIDRNMVRDKYNELLPDFKFIRDYTESNSDPIVIQSTQNSDPIVIQNGSLKILCEHCGTEFSHKSN